MLCSRNHATAILLAASASALATGAASANDLLVPSQIPSIQIACDIAGPGDRVVLEPGEYFEPVFIFGKVDLTIVGSGPGTVLNGGMLIAGSQFVRISDLDMQSTTSVDGCDGVAFREVRFIDSFGSATMMLVSNSGQIDCSSCAFFNSNEANSGQFGIRALASFDLRIFDCAFTDIAFPILLEQVNGVLIDSTRVSAGQLDVCAVTVSGSALVNVTGSAFRRTLLTSSRNEDVTISANKFTGSEVSIEESIRAQVASNKFAAAPRNAIEFAALHVQDSAGAVLIGNRFRRTANEAGIKVDSTGVLLESNNMKKCGGKGIHLLQGGNTLIGNTVKRSGEIDLFDETRRGNAFENNTFGSTNL